jgi:hypothetical protein
MAPSAKQLREIPESLHKHQLLKALDLEIQDDWISTVFATGGGETFQFTGDGWISFAPDPGNSASRFITAKEMRVLVRSRWPRGTPTGDALRIYLRRWGWRAPEEQPVESPQADTMTIT